MSELPEDIAKAGQDIVARLQNEAREDMAKGLAEAFAAFANETPEFAEMAQEFDKAFKAALPPELRARQEALDADIAIFQQSGGKLTDNSELQKRMQELLEDPAYQQVMEDMMGGEDMEWAEEEIFAKIDRLTIEALSPELRAEYEDIMQQMEGGNDDVPDHLREALSNRLDEIITCEEYLMAQAAANNKVMSEDLGLDADALLAAAPRNPTL